MSVPQSFLTTSGERRTDLGTGLGVEGGSRSDRTQALDKTMDVVIGRLPTNVPRARLVLQDALYVRKLIEDETGKIEWRLYWVLLVTLLRAVGHVLRNVDGANDPRVSSIVSARYKTWKKDAAHAIFRDFIETERNSILKEYAFQVTEGPVTIMAHLQQADGFDTVRQFLLEENLYRPMDGGAYDGEDARTLADEAIEWWTNQLAVIDQEVRS